MYINNQLCSLDSYHHSCIITRSNTACIVLLPPRCAGHLCDFAQEAASMPRQPRVRHRDFQVDADFLPSPATKLVITECFEEFPGTSCWAWLIVAAFYDCHGRPIWSTEVFYAQLNTDTESESDETVPLGNWPSGDQDQGMYACRHMLSRGLGTDIMVQRTTLTPPTTCSIACTSSHQLASLPRTTFVPRRFRLTYRFSLQTSGTQHIREQFPDIGKLHLNHLSTAGYILGSLTFDDTNSIIPAPRYYLLEPAAFITPTRYH